MITLPGTTVELPLLNVATLVCFLGIGLALLAVYNIRYRQSQNWNPLNPAVRFDGSEQGVSTGTAIGNWLNPHRRRRP